MSDDPWPFHELVGAQQKIYPENGEFTYESREKSKWHRIAPHVDHVADQTETAVTTCAEYPCDQRRVDGGAHDVVGVDKQHIFQVMHGCLRKLREMQHKRSGEQYKHAADCAGDDGQFHQLGGIFFCALHVPFAHHVSEQYAARAGGAETEYGTEIPDNDHERVCGNRIGSHMPENHRVHGESDAPCDVVAQGRQGESDKILKQQFIAQEHIAKLQLDILAENGYHNTAGQLDDAGQGCGDCHAGGAELRRAEKPEDKHGVQKDV